MVKKAQNYLPKAKNKKSANKTKSFLKNLTKLKLLVIMIKPQNIFSDLTATKNSRLGPKKTSRKESIEF